MYARSVNYTFILDMSEILDNIYIWVFSINSESVLLLALVKYMLCSHFTQNCIFCTFRRLKIFVLWQKLFKIFLYLCIYFIQKTAQFISQKLHNSGMVGRRKLPDRSLNHIEHGFIRSNFSFTTLKFLFRKESVEIFRDMKYLSWNIIQFARSQ